LNTHSVERLRHDSRLGAYELALLFLSAYLHDIGMNPPKSVVDEHKAYILTGASKELYQYTRLDPGTARWRSIISGVRSGSNSMTSASRRIAARYLKFIACPGDPTSRASKRGNFSSANPSWWLRHKTTRSSIQPAYRPVGSVFKFSRIQSSLQSLCLWRT